MKCSLFDAMEAHGYENIFFCSEKELGLRAIIVIHDTTLGPAAGGVRIKLFTVPPTCSPNGALHRAD